MFCTAIEESDLITWFVLSSYHSNLSKITKLVNQIVDFDYFT